MIQFSLTKLLNAVLLAVSAASSMAQGAPPPTMMTIVVDEAGPAWKRGRPLEEQNMGPHLGYVDGLFKTGKVIAYGAQGESTEVFFLPPPPFPHSSATPGRTRRVLNLTANCFIFFPPRYFLFPGQNGQR